MNLPKDIVDEYADKAEDITFMGISLCDMTERELLAVAGYAVEEIGRTRDTHRRDITFLTDLREARNAS